MHLGVFSTWSKDLIVSGADILPIVGVDIILEGYLAVASDSKGYLGGYLVRLQLEFGQLRPVEVGP
tara:strand:- start:376 stop:573 length:198 start_codon:yes stop_codon:yes gene_type:complete